jgi:hypothetical protein
MSFDELLAAATALREAIEKAVVTTRLPADVDRDGVKMLRSSSSSERRDPCALR